VKLRACWMTHSPAGLEGHPDSEHIRTQLLTQAVERYLEHRQDPR
jgi:hypothetical protein